MRGHDQRLRGFDRALGARRGTGETDAQAEARDPHGHYFEARTLLAAHKAAHPKFTARALAVFNGHARLFDADTTEDHIAVVRALARTALKTMRAARASAYESAALQFGVTLDEQAVLSEAHVGAFVGYMLMLRDDPKTGTLTEPMLHEAAAGQLDGRVAHQLRGALATEAGWQQLTVYLDARRRFAHVPLRPDPDLAELADPDRLHLALTYWLADGARPHELLRSLAHAFDDGP